MKAANFIFLGFAVAAAISIMLIGVAIAEESILGILLSIAAFTAIMGFGFVTKKKFREQGKL